MNTLLRMNPVVAYILFTFIILIISLIFLKINEMVKYLESIDNALSRIEPELLREKKGYGGYSFCLLPEDHKKEKCCKDDKKSHKKGGKK